MADADAPTWAPWFPPELAARCAGPTGGPDGGDGASWFATARQAAGAGARRVRDGARWTRAQVHALLRRHQRRLAMDEAYARRFGQWPADAWDGAGDKLCAFLPPPWGRLFFLGVAAVLGFWATGDLSSLMDRWPL